ncbi:28S ribosomal protein S15, mitochondrial [Trichinella spiralis]|uniref:28S ribosomal protein S15, mitochondrial n=2 Tax=Trichinella spiralis TaxID=6334 RepID=A0A0V1B195_TRISP|nr:28S ribosomal protein S15, mitochondrial [Trichinella spiralis]
MKSLGDRTNAITPYKNDADFALQAKIIIPLASVPIDGLEQVVDNLAGHIPDELQLLLDWFEDSYVVVKIVEVVLKAELGMAHATIWKLIESLRKVQHAGDLFYEQLVAGHQPPQKLKKLRDADERIAEIVSKSSGELIHSAARLTSLRCFNKSASTNKTEIDVCPFFYKDHGVQEIPHVNRFKRLCFGLSCSPFLVMCVIRYHARKYQNKFPETVNEILENICVDDLLLMKKDDPQRCGQRFAYNCLINGFLCLKLGNLDLVAQKPGWLRQSIYISINHRRKLLRLLREQDNESFENVLNQLKIAYYAPPLNEDLPLFTRKGWIEYIIRRKVEMIKEDKLRAHHEILKKRREIFLTEKEPLLAALNEEEKAILEELNAVVNQSSEPLKVAGEYAGHEIDQISENEMHSYYYMPNKLETERIYLD